MRKGLYKLGICIVLLAVLVCFEFSPVYATSWTVVNTSDNYLSPDNGSLRYAIENSASGDIITFALASYPETIILDGHFLEIEKGLSIQGPGADQLSISGNGVCGVFNIDTTESVDISGISIVSGYTILAGGGIVCFNSGPRITDCIFSNNRAVYSGGAMYNCAGSRPTVTNCTFEYNSARIGGAIYNHSSNSIILDCIFERNRADGLLDGKGGAMYNLNSNPLVEDCTFLSNGSMRGGGAIYNDFSSPDITNCTFYESYSATVGGGIYNEGSSSPRLTNCTFYESYSATDGGCIYNEGPSSPTLTGCTLSENSAEDCGGGMYNGGTSSPTLTNCTLSGNSAYKGGGMFNSDDSSSTLTDCTLSENSAGSDGGGIYSERDSSPTLISCTFSGNSAVYNGGGMANCSNISPTLTNCTFFGNSAGYHGGGIWNYLVSSLSVTNCTFYENSAEHYGGGMAVFHTINTTTLTNCIFWNGNGGEIYTPDPPSALALSNCVVQSDDYDPDSSSGYVTSADPLLQPLADNGGPTWTCALGKKSSAIDTGLEIAEILTDQRGVPRPQKKAYDIGAYEYEQGSHDEDLDKDTDKDTDKDKDIDDMTFSNSGEDTRETGASEDGGGGGCNMGVFAYSKLLLIAPIFMLARKIK